MPIISGQYKRGICILLLLAGASLGGQDAARAQSGAPASSVTGGFPGSTDRVMAGVTPAQSEALRASRIVPQSDIPATLPQMDSSPPLPVPAGEPTLSRPLPTDPPPAGFTRADLATRGAGGETRKSGDDAVETLRPQQPRTISIPEEVPVLGK